MIRVAAVFARIGVLAAAVDIGLGLAFGNTALIIGGMIGVFFGIFCILLMAGRP